ncbi:MAG: lipopolysaccharide transport periplasmic protein LptA [Spongiibacteraceae bacterium]|nr:lipopolysaccharide transport periplasmic protein LptA [Spongiibacteraceae bacterium]
MLYPKKQKQHTINLTLTPLAQCLAALLLAMGSSAALSLPEDSQQIINIQADRSVQQVLKDGTQKSEYFGSVLITQGSMMINGEQVTIISKDEHVTNVIAIGQPARFQQQSTPSKPPMKARAQNITYQLSVDTVILANDAMIEQDGSTISGDHIEYNVASEKVQANRGADHSSRVHMVLKPVDKKTTK